MMNNKLISSLSYRNVVFMDQMVSLTDTKGNMYSPYYINQYQKIYYIDNNNNITFIKDDLLLKYDICYIDMFIM